MISKEGGIVTYVHTVGGRLCEKASVAVVLPKVFSTSMHSRSLSDSIPIHSTASVWNDVVSVPPACL